MAQTMVGWPSLHDVSSKRSTAVPRNSLPAGTGMVLGAAPSRRRAESFSDKTQEAVKALAPPVSVPVVFICILWYFCSAVSNSLAKSVLDNFKYPVTLTMVQFFYAIVFSTTVSLFVNLNPKVVDVLPLGMVSASRLALYPSREIIRATFPMAGFQIVGHLLSYISLSQIPVSLVHAVKSLSPLFTVLAYVCLFKARYTRSTYLSLIPLSAGVMMACSAEFIARPLAILYALIATLVFVSQNIYSKTLLTASGAENQPRRLDKLTILCWCAIMGFIGTFPIWVFTDGVTLVLHGLGVRDEGFNLTGSLMLNGMSHFCQNMLAFLALGSISPVSYSVASLLKRICVITVAVVWFHQPVTSRQGWGIIISFTGLYLYDRFGKRIDSTTLPT